MTRDRTLLLATQKDAQTVQLYELDPRTPLPSWKGYSSLAGQLDGDFFAPGEVYLPIVSSGTSRIVSITRATIRQKIGAGTLPDQDKDGVVDALDDCPKSYDPAQTGCPPATSAVLYGSSHLSLADRVQVVGTNALIAAAGTLATTIGVDAKLTTLQSKAAVTLGDRTRAQGSITSGGNVALGNGAGADGGIKQNVPVAIDPLSAFSVTFPAPGGPVLLAPDQQQGLTPGSYGRVTVNARSVLSLSGGDYFFQSLDLEPQAELVLDTRRTPVRIYVKSSLIFRGGATDSFGQAPRFLLAYLGTASATIESGFDGTVVAPNATVTLASLVHNGAFYAKDLQVQAGAKVNYVPFTNSWFPKPS